MLGLHKDKVCLYDYSSTHIKERKKMPDWSEENNFNGIIAGIDEAGRGPWVGPVVAGAVVFFTRNINPVLL